MRTNLIRSLLPVALSVFSAAALHAQSPYANAVTALNPIGYWPLQETIPAAAANIEINNGSLGAIANMYYGTNASTITSVGGPMGNSAKWFHTGTAAFALVPTTDNRVSLPPGGPFSVEVWAAPQTYGDYAGIICQSGVIPQSGPNGTTNRCGYEFGQNYYPMIDDGSGTYSGAIYGWTFTVYSSNGNFGGACAVAPYEFQTNVWYHLVGTFDGVNCHLYVNGFLASPPDLETTMPVGTSFVPDTWDPLQVCASRGTGANFLNELVSEFAVYTNALSANAISNHYYQSQQSFTSYESAVSASNPYMYYHMNSYLYFNPTISSWSSWPTAANYGTAASITTNLPFYTNGNGVINSGIYQPGTLPGVAGPSYAGFGSPSYACAFNGLQGGVDCGFTPAFLPSVNQSLTVTLWFKCNPADNNSRYNTVISQDDSSWKMKITNGIILFDEGANVNYGDQSLPAQPNVPLVNINDNNWHMFTGLYNATNGANTNNSIYIDGVLITNYVANKTGVNNGAATNWDVWIGSAPDHATTSALQTFAGQEAHVAFFNYALTPAQIQGLYDASEPPPMIQVQPASVPGVLAGGSTASFFVVASGAGSTGFSYQWWLTNAGGAVQLSDGPNFAGSATSNLVVTSAMDSQSGSYYVVVSNSYGAVTSTLASLSISTEPDILGQTGTGTLQLYVGQNYTFAVNAVGSNITYQWYTNTVADTTAGTSSTYAINNAQLSQIGETFSCTVSGPLTSVNSSTVTLSVVPLPSSLTAGGTYSSNILALAPTAYWPLHEVAPGLQGDVETNLGTLGALGNALYSDWDPLNISNYFSMDRQVPGAIVNDPDTALTCKRGPASYLTIPHISPQATITAPFSLECWVMPDANPGNAYINIIGQGGGTGNPQFPAAPFGGFDLEFGYSGSGAVSNCFSFVLWNGNGSANNELTSTSIYPENPLGAWFHVVATFDGTNAAMYVNGSQVSSFQHGSTVYSMNPDYWSPLVIGGGRWAGGGPGNPYAGVIDEVAIYTNVLNSTTVSNHYTAGTTGASGVYKAAVLALNPLLYYRMDAPPYTQPPQSAWPVATNYGSLPLNAVYSPGLAPGSYTNGLTIGNLGVSATTPFNGNGGYVDCGLAPQINPLGYTSFSYTAFFKGYPVDGRTYSCIMAANDSDWRNIMNGGKLTSHGTADTTTPLSYNDGNWHQCVVTYTGNATLKTGTNLAYVDGVVVATNVTANTNNAYNAGASWPYVLHPEVLIGNEYGFWMPEYGASGNIGTERCFSGSICDAAFFYGTVLTAPQIQALYDAAGVAPLIVTQPFSTNVNELAAFTNDYVLARGSSNSLITYQWYSNNVQMAGQTATNLVLNPVQANSGASYYCVASSPFGMGTSFVAVLTVNTNVQFVTSQPAATNLTVLGGSTVNFAVTTSGATPITYFWSSNTTGTAKTVVQGVNSNTFTLTNIQTASGGTYSVIASNFLNTITDTWTVTVIAAPGGFPQAVLALKPFGYWRLNEADDTLNDGNNGAICHDYINGNDGIYTNTILSNPGYNFVDFGDPNYDPESSACFASTTYPLVSSCVFNIPNVDFTAPGGSNAEFTVQAWALGTNNTLNTPNIASKGVYYNEEMALDGGNGDKYRFTIRTAASGAAINANSGVSCSDGLWHFLVGVCDQTSGNIYLYIDGTNAATAAAGVGSGIWGTFASLGMNIGARSSDEGSSVTSPIPITSYEQYFRGCINDVAVFKYALSSNQILSEYFAAGIGPQFIAEPPATTNISPGQNLILVAAAQGTPTIYYQWLDTNSNPVPNATNATLVVSNIQADNAYSLEAYNAYGTNIFSNTVVSVIQGPPVVEIDIQPANAAVLAGGTVVFTVDVAGSPTINYGWQLNSNPVVNTSRISGANTSILTIADAQPSDAGTYQLFMTNGYGTNLSSQATLTVVPVLSFNSGIGWTHTNIVAASFAWLGSNSVQLTADIGSEASSLFFDSPMYIGGFQASYTYQATGASSTLADGVTFCIQNDSRGPAAIGGAGGSLGVSGITPSVELEFNIYPSYTIGINFATNGFIASTYTPPGPVTLNSGDPINTVITYANGLVTVVLTDQDNGATFTTNIAANIPATVGGNTAYVGFTAADGGSEAFQDISNFQIEGLVAITAQVSGGNLLLSWPTSAGAYAVASTTNLMSPWTVISAPQSLVNNQIQVSVPVPTGPAIFYKLVLQ